MNSAASGHRPMPQCLIEATHTPYASIHVMMEDIGYALKSANIGVTQYLFHPDMQTGLYTHLVKELAAFSAPRLLFDINGKSNPALRATPDGGHLLDRLDIRQITFLVDSPFQHLDTLRQGSEKGILLYLDRDFGPQIEALDLPYKTHIFFPHGGPDVLAPARPLTERSHDLLFAGNIFAPPAFSDWLAAAGITDSAFKTALERAAERILHQCEPVIDSLDCELEQAGISLPIEHKADLNTRLEHFVNGTYRWNIISRLKETNLTICGEIHRDAPLPNDRHQVLGPTLFRDILNRMADSKFLLNLCPNYRNGAHERVFYGMNRGTVILNSQSRYLQPEADQDLGIRLIPDNLSDIDGWYQARLDELPHLESRRPAALQHFLDHHCWSKRLAPVLEAAGL